MSTPPILRRLTSGISRHHPRGRRHKEGSTWVDGITDLRVTAIEAFHERGIFRETTTRHACASDRVGIAVNYLRTTILLAGLTALFMVVGYLIGGPNGSLIAFFFAAATNFITYWNADRLVLSTQGAHEVDKHAAPEFVHLVAELADRAGLPMPRVYIMDNPQPNAFATGRNPQNAA